MSVVWPRESERLRLLSGLRSWLGGAPVGNRRFGCGARPRDSRPSVALAQVLAVSEESPALRL